MQSRPQQYLGELLDHLQQVIGHLSSAVYICEAPTGVIRLFNRRAVELWGREPEIGDSQERFCGAYRLFRIDGEPLPHDRTPMADALTAGGVHDEEVIMERPDGSRVVVRVSIAPLLDPAGQIAGAINVFHDISSAKRLEAELHANEARYRAIVESDPDLVCRFLPDGTLTFANAAYCRYFGLREDEVIGRRYANLLHGEDEPSVADGVASLNESNPVVVIENRVVRGDGAIRWTQWTNHAIHDDWGRLVELQSTGRDITERKRAEEALRRRERELSDFFENAALPVHWAAADGTILHANKAELAMLGYTGDEYVGRNARDFHVDSAVIDAILARLRAGESIDREPARLRCKDGTVREVLISSNVLWEDGRFVHMRCFTHDVTDRRRLEREREELLARETHARAQAEAASQAKDEFLAMLAHELRNPLSVISNAVALIERPEDVPESVRRSGVVIRRQTRHLARLLDDLLDVARITNGRIELARKHFDVRQVVELAVEAEQHRIDAKRQRLEVSMPADPVTVAGDLVRVQQLVGNLLNNASKYTPAEGSIRLTLEAGDALAVLQVADDGVGIPKDKLEKIFDLFVQADPTLARSEGGLGIGLTLVKRIVELHGGTVVAKSEGPRCGARLTVKLPLAVSLPEPFAPAIAQPQPALQSASRRLLVIEDNDDGREMLVAMLRMSGYHVVHAANGREGIELAHRERPDAVLLDIGLPDIDGYHLGHRLREDLGPSVVIVALTGYGQPHDRARSKAAGFDAHLVKPVDLEQLTATLHR